MAGEAGEEAGDRVRPQELSLQGPRNLPPGTQVVLVQAARAEGGELLKPGTAARVLRREGERVVVTTPSGREVSVAPGALVLQREAGQPAQRDDRAAWEAYRERVVLVTRVGSTAWNLTVRGSDEDHRGCYLAPFQALTALDPPPASIQDPEADGTYWELDKLIRLGLKADPNLIEALYGPVVEARPFGERILAARQAFLSRRVLSTFGRYALAQLELLRKRRRRNELLEEAAGLWRDEPTLAPEGARDALASRLVEREGKRARQARKEAQAVLVDLARALHDRGELPDRDLRTLREHLLQRDPPAPGWLLARSDKPKHAVHLLRILHSGLQLLEGRGPLIRVEGDLRAELLRIRRGDYELEQVLAQARELSRRMEAAVDSSPLPPHPDREAAEALLRAGRRAAYAELAGEGRAWPAPAPAGAPALPAAAEAFLAGRRERHLLVALSGSRAFGYAGPGSDVDLLAVHLAPTREVLGPRQPPGAAKALETVDGLEVDYASLEAGRVVGDLIAGRGAALERVLVPADLLVRAHPRLDELRGLARAALSRAAAPHYQGLVRSRLAACAERPRVKLLLHGYRAALTGLHLLRAGEVEVRLPELLERVAGYEAAGELLARRADPPADLGPWVEELTRAAQALEEAAAASPLPAAPAGAAALEAWLVALRLESG